MKSPEYLRPQGGRFNLTPMIDVVFLLIIFFVVSNNLIQQDNALPLDLPEAETGTIPEEPRTKQLTISVPAAGTLFAGTEPINQDQLRQLIMDCRKDWGEETEIRIRTNKDVPYGEIKKILVTAAESDVVHVSFAVTER